MSIKIFFIFVCCFVYVAINTTNVVLRSTAKVIETHKTAIATSIYAFETN